MTKSEFIKLCESHHGDPQHLRITVEAISREIYPGVHLNGCWGRFIDGEFHCFFTSKILFTPQWRATPFQEWRNTCEARAVKFRRWLEEHKKGHPTNDHTPTQ